MVVSTSTSAICHVQIVITVDYISTLPKVRCLKVQILEHLITKLTNEGTSCSKCPQTMLRNVPNSLIPRSFSSAARQYLGARLLSFRAEDEESPSVEEQKEARQWLADYNSSTIPKRICQLTSSRSSGPGGQHVNTYNDGVIIIDEG